MEKNKISAIQLNKINIQDSNWSKYIDLVEKVILPFQWDLINDRVEGAQKSYCIQNFKVACKDLEGTHQGTVFQDTDVAKWLEAVAYSLAKKPNAKLEALADSAIDLIERAQCEDGYLNTYYTIHKKERWQDLFEGHELYTAGHMIEAAVAYYQATGKRRFLDVMCRFADYIITVFGKEEGKRKGYPGHPEIELALIKLYHVTQKEEYRELADFFVKERGTQPCYFLQEDWNRTGEYIFPEFKDFEMDYVQAHMPLLEQETAEGHAVRAVYLYSAMADLAFENQDESLLLQCEKLWNNIVTKRMYLTGSIGSASYGERFTCDYDLPNNTNYSETCATIGLAMFSLRMFQITRDGKYMDVVEKALYNSLLSGIALDGKHFFYVNPLEVAPEIAEHNPTMHHVKTTRQQWFGVACCPPNITRTLASMGNYIYSADSSSLFVNLFISSQAAIESGSQKAELTMNADFPADGKISLRFNSADAPMEYTIALRIPEYVKQFQLYINGKQVQALAEQGYVYLNRIWADNDQVELILDVPFRFLHSNPRVRDNIGKIALSKGPVIYCLEEVDNGEYLTSVRVKADTRIEELYDRDLLGGTLCAVFSGEKINYACSTENLYAEEKPIYQALTLKAIPYSSWNNRGRGEMLVWMREQE